MSHLLAPLSFRWTVALTVAALLSGAAPSSAQTQIPGVRAAARDGQAGQSLVIDLSGALGRDILRADDQSDTPLLDRDVTAGSATGSLAYSLSRSWVSTRAYAASAGRYFTGTARDWSVIHYGGADLGLNRALTPRTTLAGRAGVSYQPISATTLFPDLFRPEGAPPLPTEFDLATPLGTYLSSDLGVRLTRALSRRSTLSGDYMHQYRGSIVDGGPGQSIDTASILYGRGLTRWMSLRLGYGYSTTGALSDTDTPIENHRIDLGINVDQALSFSRRTMLSLSSGTVATSDGQRTRFDIVGNVGLSHQFSTNTSAGVGYNRRVDFVQTFAQPTFTDSLSASFDGQVGRVTLSSGAGISRGQVGIDSDNDYWASQSSVGASLALTRFLSLRADYAYYRYRFSTSTFLPIGIGERVRRHHFQIGTGLSLPLIGRSRSRNASR